MLSEEECHQACALKHLRTFDPPDEALLKAAKHPDIALVDAIFEVECYLWDGTEHIGYTTDGPFANEVCHGLFGWVVRKISKWQYKYSRIDGKTNQIRNLQQWIRPGDFKSREPGLSRAASLSPSDGRETKAYWHACTVQIGLFLAAQLRRNLWSIGNEPLDTTKLLSEGFAKWLTPIVTENHEVLQGEYKTWFEKSAKPHLVPGARLGATLGVPHIRR